MAKKLIVGNWKMHTSVAEAELLAERLTGQIKPKDGVEVVLCPPAISLSTVKSLIEGKFSLGIQNVYQVDEGAYTGEVSAEMVRGLVDYAIVGHSERRIHFGERDGMIAHKVAACLRHDIAPILCVGEKIADRVEGHAKRVIGDQLAVDLGGVTPDEIERVVIAYEPVWAIGTGEFAKPHDVEVMVRYIRAAIKEAYSAAAGKNIKLLYGGSVDPDNARSYLEVDGVDGLLVGGASINYAKFASIVDKAG